MNNKLTSAERKHIGKVKALGCSVCGAPGPSSAHHIDQSAHYCTISLCLDCHQGQMGIHGTKALWRIYKHTEITALNETIRRLAE